MYLFVNQKQNGWAGLAAGQGRVIAADRKYQAFNYRHCHHIIARNKRSRESSGENRSQILLTTLATGARKAAASITELF